ncbi:Gfo/Idh/MocA family protein [Erwinia sp. CGal63]|uniref:Gfo/Idh/MocA family protein n=1 Tax=Erwinia sp. CGal63 TaxID=2919889 RepID=UPI003007FE50
MLNGEKKLARPLRWAMVGGGRLSQVGYKHRSGALHDNTAFQLVAGAFDIDADRGRDFGVHLGLDADRCYADYRELFSRERQHEEGIEVVTIATPNGTHYEITKAALEAGLHVICEKPLFFTSQQAREVKALAAQKNRIVGVTYGYSGHPMLLQMRQMIASGEIGEVRMVDMRYTHGFSASDSADKFEAQKWRVDPAVAGPSFVLGDLSTHTFYISQLVLPELKLQSLLCDRQSFIASRAPLEDNAMVMMRYHGGAVGRMWTSSVDAGSMNAQQIRVIGSKASLQWCDWLPNELRYEVQNQPSQLLHHGMAYLDQAALAEDRLGALHTEGLTDAWANIYLRCALAIDAKNRGDETALANLIYPDIDAGLEGVRWVENCVRSADSGAIWVNYE